MFGRRPAPEPPAEPSLAAQLLDLLGPLEPNARSPLALLLCALCWELLYRISQLACRALAPVLVRSDYSKGGKAFRNHGSTYVCAFVHAVLTGGRGVWHVWQLLGAPLDAKLAVPDASSPHYAAAASTELTNLFFLSWLMYDTVHVLSSYPVLGGADTVAHHVCFAAGAAITAAHRALPFQFAWLITGECSSPLLNVRWFLINTGRGDTPAMQAVNLAFGLTFFTARILLFTLGLSHMALNANRLVALRVLPPPQLACVCAILAAGYALNLTWAAKIWAMAFGTKKRGKGPSHEGANKTS